MVGYCPRSDRRVVERVHNWREAGQPVSRRTDHTDTSSLENFLRPIVEQFGCDLEAADITPAGRRRLLRVLVDRDGGISFHRVCPGHGTRG